MNKQQVLEQAMPTDWRLLDQNLEQSNEAIFDMLRDRSNMEAQIVSVKQQVEEARAFLVVNGGIDGKNEEQRRAQLTLLLKGDEDYQALCCHLADLQATYEARGAELEYQRNTLTALKIKARIAAAMLEYLAAE